MPSLLAGLLLLPFIQRGGCEPTISFPFNAQLPPVARIDHFFSYSFSEYTFQSDSAITYTLGDHPSWLSIESQGRRLYGTPQQADVADGQVVGQNVDIIATDDKGSTTMNATIVVSRRPVPSLQIPLRDQIKNFGNFSAPASILSYPSTNFEFSFDQNTFGSSGLNYYAVSGDSSPLPAWVRFDAASLTFSGRTPPVESLIQPPQTFDFSLVASDVVGFSASELKFSIVVGSHKLTTDHPIVTLNATRGTAVNYNGLETGIKLDGKQISPGSLTVTTTNIPRWLSYNGKTGKLQGTPKDGDHAANFTITFKDSFSDNLDVLVVVNVATGLFESTFEDLEVRPGSKFSLDLTKHFKDPNDLTVKVSTSPTMDWLRVDGLKLSGDVPKTSKGSFKLIIEASSKSSVLSEKETVNVNFLAPDGTTTIATSITSTATSTATSTSTTGASSDKDEAQSGHLSTGEILLATLIPVIFVALLLMILVCYFRRRRDGQSYLGSKYRSKIAHAMSSTWRTNSPDPSLREAANTGVFLHTEKHVSKPAQAAFADRSSPMSSQGRSSETLGDMSVPEMPPSIMGGTVRTRTIRSISNFASEDGRQSWVTIEGGQGGIAPSERSLRTQQSDAPFPEPPRQIFPGADYVPRRDAASEFTLPTLDELPSLQPTPLLDYEPPRTAYSQYSTGGQSAMTCSSAALPSLGDNYTTATPISRWPTISTARVEASEPNWVALAESEAAESISELRRPDAAALRSSRPLSDSLDGARSFTTDLSFESSENWRVIGRQSPTKTIQSYREIIDEIPFRLSRPSTARDGAQPGERDFNTPELASPARWKDVVPSPLASGRIGPSASMLSRISGAGTEGTRTSGGKGPADDSWMRDYSGKVSEGSFQVFI